MRRRDGGRVFGKEEGRMSERRETEF